MSTYAENLRGIARTRVMTEAANRILRGAADEIDAERALADDLADALHRVQHGGYDADVETAEVEAVLARYREARR